jgi:hypothetical protein
MKTVICLFLILAISSLANTEEGILSIGSAHYLAPDPNPTIIIREDGQVFLNDKPIESLSHPEVKEILREIAKSMMEWNRGWKTQMDVQTDYLLKELEACQSKCK